MVFNFRKRWGTFLTITVFSSSTYLFSSEESSSSSPKPNILLILSDDHSFPYLGCYGHPDLDTPNLDNLARKGVRFDNVYTCAPQCVPSRASILSGRNVIDIKMSRFSAPLPREVITIPEFLVEADYYTGVCGRHYHLDGSVRMPEETIEAFRKFELITFHDRVDFLKTGPDNMVLSQFKEFLDERPPNKPFFMWMNYSDPHRHWTARSFEPDPENIKIPATMPDTKEVRKDLARHLGEINRLDYHIGQVIEELEKRGLKKNTQIIFLGDNGAALLRGKGTLYDLGLHVPMIVNGPLVKEEGRSSNALISGDDIAPTILEMAGLASPPEMTGKSFYPVLNGDNFQGNEFIFAQRLPHSSGLPLHTGYFDLSRTVFNRDYKLIYNALWQLPYWPVDFNSKAIWKDLIQRNNSNELEEKFAKALFSDPRPMFELYDLKNDPEELINLIGNPEYEEIEQSLKAELHEWMILYKDYLPLPIPPP